MTLDVTVCLIAFGVIIVGVVIALWAFLFRRLKYLTEITQPIEKREEVQGESKTLILKTRLKALLLKPNLSDRKIDVFLNNGQTRSGFLREVDDAVVVDQVVSMVEGGILVPAKRYTVALEEICILETTILTPGGME